ncbi:recQ-like DNA helicase BLM [Leptopilina boulardi]|uniref:recQ-like DNA helicase BLM n=1 Tax=Leptopilina boulardi TaxID=63433 RepID=UPI0021F5F2BF|nr:recQ-like DNA helicase BLM [Leptopilina boulardi]
MQTESGHGLIVCSMSIIPREYEAHTIVVCLYYIPLAYGLLTAKLGMSYNTMTLENSNINEDNVNTEIEKITENIQDNVDQSETILQPQEDVIAIERNDNQIQNMLRDFLEASTSGVPTVRIEDTDIQRIATEMTYYILSDKYFLNMNLPNAELIAILNQRFGLQNFRSRQIDIIRSVIEKKDGIYIMATGEGKTLTYIYPNVMENVKCAIIVSPLLALIQDQYNYVTGLNFKALMLTTETYLNGTILRDLLTTENEIDKPNFIFITPEKLFTNMNVLAALREAYANGQISRIVLDEIHCLNDWGLTFRSSYLNLNRLKIMFPGIQISCYSATLNRPMVEAIINQLSLNDPDMLV